MKYELIVNEYNMYFENYAYKVLRNKGIKNPQEFLNLNDDRLNDYNLLAGIENAAKKLLESIENSCKIGIIQDQDSDGLCSASMLYSYLKKNFVSIDLHPIFHRKAKTHGLSGDLSIPEDVQVLIIPDASSNDIEQCKELYEKGISIIILDHHQIEKENPYAIVVNPYLNDYSNKFLSGGAVTFKFMQCLDSHILTNESDYYLDLVALSLISDSMDISEYENKRLVDKGIAKINNKAFKALVEKQDYSIRGIVSPMTIAFYITPLINAIVRSGSQEEKEMMFRAFCEIDEFFPYKKRSGEIIQESIYDRVARLATNAKAKQNREIDNTLSKLIPQIEQYGWNKNKIMFVNAEGIDTAFTGLIAMKLSSKYNKPCFLIRETDWKQGYMMGSARNFDGSPIDDLKAFVLDTGLFESAQGHPGAFGISLETSKIRDIIAKTNEILADVDFERIWKLDFIFNSPYEITEDFIKEMDSLKSVGMGDGLFLVKNVRLNTRKNISLMGKEESERRHWSFTIPISGSSEEDIWCDNEDTAIKVIKWNKEGEPDQILELLKDNWNMDGKEIVMDIICRADYNAFGGVEYPTMYIQDYEFVEIEDKPKSNENVKEEDIW